MTEYMLEMKLHEVIGLFDEPSLGIRIQRVPGGFNYIYTMPKGVAVQFVQDCNEFKEPKK